MNKKFKICFIILGILLIASLIYLYIAVNSSGEKQLTLSYDTNSGVPYKWEYEIEDKDIVKFVKSYTEDKKTNKDMVGYPVKANYVFEGLKKGETTISFKYVSITTGEIEKEEKSRIKVDSNKNIVVTSRLIIKQNAN